MLPYTEQLPNYKFVEPLGGAKGPNNYINSIMNFLLSNQRTDKKKPQYQPIALPALHELTMGDPSASNRSERQQSPLDFNLSRVSLASQLNSPPHASPQYIGQERGYTAQEGGEDLGKRGITPFDSESLLLSGQVPNPKKLVLDGYSFEGSEFGEEGGLRTHSAPPSPDAGFRSFQLFEDHKASPSPLSRDQEFIPKETPELL